MVCRVDRTGAVLEVTLSHLPNSVLQEMVKPVIEIDGVARRVKWGFIRLDVAPGPHHVKAYHRWGPIKQAYASEIDIEVPEAGVARLEWRTGSSSVSPGVWTVL